MLASLPPSNWSRPPSRPAAILAPGSLAVSTAADGWPAVLLAAPLALLGLAATGW